MLIIGLGLLVGLTVLGQPLLDQYCEGKVCETDHHDEDAADADKSSNGETISMLEAVTPVQQVSSTATNYFVLDEFWQDTEENSAGNAELFQKIFNKFIRVLFNFILSPNAP